MATLSYSLSRKASVISSGKTYTSTAKCTVTITYAVTGNDTSVTVTASRLAVSAITVSGGNSASQSTARSDLVAELSSGVFAFYFNSSSLLVASRTGATANTSYTYTGSKSVTKTHSAQSGRVYALFNNHLPTEAVPVTISAKTSYTVSFNANSGSGAPANQTKWYGETLTLTTSKPVKEGYTFKGWATSVANASAGTVNYASGATYTSNSAVTLYAVWELAYTKPSITGVSVERCDANGNSDDDGQFAKVNFNWSVFTSSLARYYGGNTYPYADNTISSASVTVGTYTETFTASDTLPLILGGGLSTDTQYDVSITITDSQSIVADHTTTVTGALSMSYFPMDFNRDATAMGIFMPAPDTTEGIFLGKDLFLPLDTSATTGTDKDIYDALVDLVWTDVIA